MIIHYDSPFGSFRFRRLSETISRLPTGSTRGIHHRFSGFRSPFLRSDWSFGRTAINPISHNNLPQGKPAAAFFSTLSSTNVVYSKHIYAQKKHAQKGTPDGQVLLFAQVFAVNQTLPLIKGISKRSVGTKSAETQRIF